MSGYRNDQFFNIDRNAGETNTRAVSRSTWNWKDADNAPFIFPSRAIRTIDPITGEYTSSNLKRGYIRSIRTKVQDIDIPVRKTQFQFNPQTLQQSVSLANSLYDVFHMPPEQFSQPFPGGVNFNFTIMFDRSMELNNPKQFAGAYGTPRPPSLDHWSENDPSVIGVLHDLGCLFETIGQGVSKAQVDYQTALLNRSIQLEANASEIDLNQTDAALGTDPADYLNMNVGNTAFLLPTPIRVLFSSLYMIEGLVQSTNVNLIKFNTNFVPMVAQVTLDVEAKYVGFAKEQTYLSYALDKEFESYQQEQATARATAQNYVDTLQSELGVVETRLATDPDTFTFTALDDLLASVNQVRKGLTTSGTKYAIRMSVPGADDDDSSISRYFENGEASSVSVTSYITVYGPVDGLVGADYKSADLPDNTDLSGMPVLLKRAVGSTSSLSTKNEWKSMERGRNGNGQYTYPSKTEAELDNKYYFVQYEVSAIANINGTVTTGIGKKKKVFGPGIPAFESFLASVPITWTPSVNVDGTIVSDNAATAPPAAGSVSPVGVPRNLR